MAFPPLRVGFQAGIQVKGWRENGQLIRPRRQRARSKWKSWPRLATVGGPANSSQNPKRRGTPTPPSLQLIRYFGNAGLAARLLLRPSHWASTQADAADCLITNFDRNAAGQR